MAQRKARENWEYSEKELLIDLIAKNEEKPDPSKHSNSVIINWNVVHKEFCKLSGRTRDITRLKQQWLRMKQNAKWTIAQSIHREKLKNNPKFKFPTGSEHEPDELSLKIKKLFPQEFSRVSKYYSLDIDKISKNYEKSEDIYDPDHEPLDRPNVKSNGKLKTVVHNKLENGVVYKQVKIKPARKQVTLKKRLSNKGKILKNSAGSKNRGKKINQPKALHIIEDKDGDVRYVINVTEDMAEHKNNVVEDMTEYKNVVEDMTEYKIDVVEDMTEYINNVVEEVTVPHTEEFVNGYEPKVKNPLNYVHYVDKNTQTDNRTDFSNLQCLCRHDEYLLQEKKLNEEIKQMKELHALRLQNEVECQQEKMAILRLKRDYWESKLKAQ